MDYQTTNKKKKGFYARIAALLLLSTGALNSSAEPYYSNTNKVPVPTSATYYSIVSDTPSLTLEDKRSKKLNLTDLKGKVVVINFWAPWCAPCREEMPGLDKLYRRLKSDPNLVFVTVDMDRNLKKSLAFMSSNRLTLPVYVAASQIPADFIGDAIPTTVILDQSGKIVFKQEGGLDFNDEHFIKYLKSLLTK
ncbi:TlpA family protein disulfide reductase [Mucilaginibacter rubeus]|jgi:thiol-disulfide isomerase/thioredoxin|uniref:TlpA family protein disulfide reductase n=1 Tax=Mucilaginibacter rubeus TaxID=2027860 RepID=A0AAE6ML01_9SPHI|nr:MULTISPECIES: TlpA disulfide reductase family protein [Mucilaginibacter]PMP66336.1 MAG: thioredoxin [Mucilaginibacter sp.]HEK21023.1 TlpA family protein disulfide reductase [Bacteroidota bacterium]NHA05645.1 TlpA family protein disulfide reductase [Mucilaginibacter inviolabilis]QEM07039.1 TlpA family protein disulfide reductase [Mucilaginibacter rubeus]QTE35449.1 TlpA disulfide reductase family protein [Mucilaginibacter gossypii]